MIRKFLIAGSLDIHIQIKIDGRWVDYVIDFKGANDWMFQYVHRNHAPKIEHVLQVLPYMRAKKVRHGAVMYDSKGKNHFYVFTFEFKKEEWKEITAWCDRVLARIEKRELPPAHPECNKGNFLGDKCPFRGICYGTRDEDTIEEEIYEGFRGIEALWQEGLRITAN